MFSVTSVRRSPCVTSKRSRSGSVRSSGRSTTATTSFRRNAAARQSQRGTSRRSGASSDGFPRPLPDRPLALSLGAVARDLLIDLLPKVGVVADRGIDLARREIAPLSGRGDRPLTALTGPAQRLDHFPDVRPPSQRSTPPRGPVAKCDPRMVLHPQALVDQALGDPRLWLAVASRPLLEAGESPHTHADRERFRG